jgi:hypothetical protein
MLIAGRCTRIFIYSNQKSILSKKIAILPYSQLKFKRLGPVDLEKIYELFILLLLSINQWYVTPH